MCCKTTPMHRTECVAFVLVLAGCRSNGLSSNKDGGAETEAMMADALEANRDAPTEASNVTSDGAREMPNLDVAAVADSASETFELPFQAATIPSPLAVPPSATLKVRYHGVGTQIYLCATSGGADAGEDLVADGQGEGPGAANDAQSSDVNSDALIDAGSDIASDAASDRETDSARRDAEAQTYAWVLVAPDALLFDETGTEVGTHSKGPTWTSKDGSTVTGITRADVAAPLNSAIPWLLLAASSHTGSGVFSDVTYIQRVNTTNGLVPMTNCSADGAGTMMSIGFTADYYFYSGAASVDAGGGADAADNG
jgi:hypothetical protein